MINAGITSFKIEGRLKDENYVRNVVSYYRKKIDEVLKKNNLSKSSIGISLPEFEPKLEKSFNRGFTEFFIDGKRKDFCTQYYSKSIGEFIGTVNSISKNYFTLKGLKLNNGDGICFLNLSGASLRFALYCGWIARWRFEPPLSKKTAVECGVFSPASFIRLLKNAWSAPVGKPSARDKSGIA